jgi:hypothetical protein
MGDFMPNFNFTTDVTTKMVVRQCHKCGVLYAIPQQLDDEMHRDNRNGEGAYCPNGHCWIYTESEKQRLAKIKAQLASAEEAKEEYRRQLESEKKRFSNLQKRIKYGVCPYCHRTFKNLQRHMDCKHNNK